MVGADALYRYYMQPEHQQSKNFMVEYTNHPGLNYIYNHDNKFTDKGRWNHNFYCWEKDKNCGRDFDWKELKKDWYIQNWLLLFFK